MSYVTGTWAGVMAVEEAMYDANMRISRREKIAPVVLAGFLARDEQLTPMDAHWVMPTVFEWTRLLMAELDERKEADLEAVHSKTPLESECK